MLLMLKSGALQTQITAVVLDVDGTVAGPDSQVSERIIEAMGSLDRRGVPVLLLTGRTRENVLAISRAAGLRSLATACNGALVVDPVNDEDLWSQPMSAEQVAQFTELAERLDLTLTWWTRDQIYVNRGGHWKDVMLRVNGGNILVRPTSDIDGREILKMMVLGEPERLDALWPELTAGMPGITRSMYEIAEVVAPGAHKWTALEYMLNQLNIDPATCLGVGDGGNDLVWLAEIGYPVAMGNAHDEVKTLAGTVIGSNDTDALAELLDQVRPAGIA